MMTNLDWLRRYFAPHPDTAHLRTSSMKYVGKVAYVQYWDEGRKWGPVAVLLGDSEHRVMLFHSTDFTADEVSHNGYSFDAYASRCTYPLAGYWWWTERVTFPTTYRVEFHADDDFQGKSDDEIINTLWERFHTRIRYKYEHIELCRQRKFRWTVRQLTGAYAAFTAAFQKTPSDEISQMLRELTAYIEETPENQHRWASSAAKVGAAHRAQFAEQRIEAQRREQENNVAVAEFKQWLSEQPFYVRWELELMSAGYSTYDIGEEAEEFRKRMFPDAFRAVLRAEREARHSSNNAFATAFIDGAGCAKIFVIGKRWWDNEWLGIESPNEIDPIIRGLEQKVPIMPVTQSYNNSYTWHTEEFSNTRWECSRVAHPGTGYGSPENRSFSPVNRSYLINRLKYLKTRMLARAETAVS